MDLADRRRRAAARRVRLRGLSTGLPVVTLFIWLCLVYGWEAWGNLAPWLNSDEFERAQLSRAVASTGHEALRTVPHAFDSLYVYLVAPAWWIHDTSRAYGAAKTIGVATMTSVVFPTYLLARMLVSRRWALFAAAGAAMIPALAYSSMLLVEPLAYPWAALCFYLLAKALVARRPGWYAAAAAACLLAPRVRNQLQVLVAGAVLTVIVYWFTGEGARRLRRNWTAWDWAGFAMLVLCAVSIVNVLASHHFRDWQVSTELHQGRMIRDGLWAGGALTIGLGVLPTVAGLTALAKPRREAWSREQRAFVALTGTMIAGFGFYTALKGAFVSSMGLTQLIERNLIYVAPLLFVGTAMVFERRRPQLRAVVAASGFALYVVTTTPYHMDIPVFFDAPGLAILPGLHRAFGLTPHGAKILLITLALASAAVLVSIRFLPKGAASAVITMAAGFALAWSVYGEISFAHSSHTYATSLIAKLPRPLDWIDRAVPRGAQVYYLGQSIDDPFDVLQLEFWNRSVQHVWSTDGTAPGPAPAVIPNVIAPNGRLDTGEGAEYVVADAGISPVGRVIARKIHYGGRGARTWTLLRITPPLRLRETIEGIYPDGWGKPKTALNEYSIPSAARSIVKVHVERTGAARRYPATVRVALGKLVLAVPQGAAGLQPVMGEVILTRTLHVERNLDHVFFFKAPTPPFRVETSVTPFPHSRDPTIGDPRDLGANVDYSVTTDESQVAGRWAAPLRELVWARVTAS